MHLVYVLPFPSPSAPSAPSWPPEFSRHWPNHKPQSISRQNPYSVSLISGGIRRVAAKSGQNSENEFCLQRYEFIKERILEKKEEKTRFQPREKARFKKKERKQVNDQENFFFTCLPRQPF